MSAGLPLLIMMLLASIVNLAWMFGHKRGRRVRITIGSLLFVTIAGSVLVLGGNDKGIWSESGSAAFAILWLTSIAMILMPLIERVVRSEPR